MTYNEYVNAFKAGMAFYEGFKYARETLGLMGGGDSLALDEDKWITTSNGHHVLIDEESGQVKYGMGGKFFGKNIQEIGSVTNKAGNESSLEGRLAKIASEVEAHRANLNKSNQYIKEQNRRNDKEASEKIRKEQKEYNDKTYKDDPKARSLAEKTQKTNRAMNQYLDQSNEIYKRWRKMDDSDPKKKEVYAKFQDVQGKAQKASVQYQKESKEFSDYLKSKRKE